MIISGIADEAGTDIQTQIKAHKELGWDAIELRIIDGKNVAGKLSDSDFQTVADEVEEAKLQVTCFASAIGNWSRNISDDFQIDINELKTAIPRMQRLGTKFIRTMSWVGQGASQDQWRDETIRRYRELAKIAEDGGVILAHENCTGWAGQSAEKQCQLIEEVDSKNLAVLFDTGNTISHGYDHWEYYQGVKDIICYIHIKDCCCNTKGGPSNDYAYVGEGDAMVKETIKDILAAGYDGVISIEPHVAAIAHDSTIKPSPQKMFESYLKYGRMLNDIIRDIEKMNCAK